MLAKISYFEKMGCPVARDVDEDKDTVIIPQWVMVTFYVLTSIQIKVAAIGDLQLNTDDKDDYFHDDLDDTTGGS